MITLIKAFFLWLMIPENRALSIRYIQLGLEMAELISSQTKNKVDDRGVSYLARLFYLMTKGLDEEDQKKVASQITNNTKSMDGLSISIDTEKKSVLADYRGVWAEYHPNNGKIEAGVKIPL